MPIFGEPRYVHVLGAAGTTSRRYGDVVVHTSDQKRTVAEVSCLRLTSLVDSTLDLCRVLPPAFAVATADATLRRLQGSGGIDDLRDRGTSFAGRRGALQLRWVLDRATPISESVGESVSRIVIAWLGYEEPELQTWFHYEGFDDRSDFYWRRQRVIGESDGYGKYDADRVVQAKAKLISEKTREDRLRRYESAFARWDWKDTVRVEPLDAKLHRAGLRPIQPRQQSLLATLRGNPRSTLPNLPF